MFLYPRSSKIFSWRLRIVSFYLLFFITMILFGGQFKEVVGSGPENIIFLFLIMFSLALLKKTTPTTAAPPIILFYAYFFYILSLSLSRAIFEGVYNPPSYLMYFVFLSITPLAFFAGYSLPLRPTQKAIEYWMIILFFTLSTSTFILMSNFLGFNINKNWAALSILFIMILRVILNNAAYTPDKIAFFSYAIFSHFFFNSQGVALASGLIFIGTLILRSYGPKSRRLALFSGFILIPLFMISPFFIGWFIDHAYGYAFSIWWETTFDQRLGSGRIAYWIRTVEIIDSKSLFFGHGLDSTISHMTAGELKNTSTHNIFIEIFLRTGAISLFILGLFYFSLLRRLVKRNMLDMVPILLSILVLGSVYSVGGLTHWPGTIFVWFLLGSLVNLATSPILKTSHF